MDWLYVVFTPLVGALIGYFTNWLAVKLLFHPTRPFAVPVIGYTIQGLLPKRRHELARQIGEVVERELLSMEDILALSRRGELTDRLVLLLSEAVHNAVLDKLPKVFPLSFKRFAAQALADAVTTQVPPVMVWLIEEICAHLKENVRISKVIEDKLNEFPLSRLEEIVFRVAATELRHIIVLGGVLGLIIGAVHVSLYYLFQALPWK